MSKSRQLRYGQPFAKSFVPKGRSAATIYAVALFEHPEVTKVGKTQKWMQRRRAYDFWNLAPGNAVRDFRTYTFIEDWVDLDQIERHVLAALPFPLRMGNEWFAVSLEELSPKLDEIIDGLGLSYM